MSETSRRTVLAGAAGVTAATILAACGTDGDTATPSTTTGGAAPTTGGAPAPTTGGAAAGLAKTSEIPVGGGKVFGSDGVVVTQLKAGDFKAFSATCTHMQCTVANVSGGTINCGCHGSKYSAEDGSVKNGPATQPLAAKQVTVQGDTIVVS
jgi:Rieske Fe-S protein